MARKITVQIDGKEVEIELPAEYLHQDDVKKAYMPKDAFQEELSRRTAGISNSTLEKLLNGEDMDTITKIAEKHGLIGKDKLNEAQKSVAEKLEAARREWEDKHLKPERTKAEQAHGRVQKLLHSVLVSNILTAAAEAGVKKPMLKPLVDGKPETAPIVSMLGSLFGYDEKTEQHYVRDGDSFAFSSTPTGGAPYKRVSEFVKEWAGDKSNTDFVESTRQASPGVGAGGGARQAGGAHVISRADAQDAQKYQAARAAAERAGATLQIAQQ